MCTIAGKGAQVSDVIDIVKDLHRLEALIRGCAAEGCIEEDHHE
jgi:hypothetical protein